MILQETHSTKEVEKIWESQWGGRILFSHGTSNAKGIAVLLTKELSNKVSQIYLDTEGRLIIFDIDDNDQIITMAAIYAPNEDTPNFFKQIGLKLKERQENKVIIGDFNLVLDVEKDRKNTHCNNTKAKEEVENLMDEFCLKEVWREHNGDNIEYSWIKRGEYSHANRKASRIDFALVSGGLDQLVKNVIYISSLQTDHRAIYMVLETAPFERGVGFWKMNTDLLANQDFVTEMNREIEYSLGILENNNPCDKWETLKKRIRKQAQRFSRESAAQQKLVIAQLSEKVNEYEARLPLTEDEDKLWINTKNELEEKYSEIARGMLFRSKVRWIEEGEKNSKYFFSLEKARYNAKTCYKMLHEGEEITHPQLILNKQKQFYEELYDVDKEVKFTLENGFGIRVPNDIRQQQQEQISIEELGVAIKAMKNNKTPGNDGIPVDFYKVFWSKIKEVFYEMVIEVYEKEKLHLTAREGILNLIPKPGKDSRLIKNLRPITLLNTDYKIIEKTIANKMTPALEHIINKDQRGFMKERRISVNIRKMLDIIHEAEKKDLEAVVLSLDFVKCFDKCSFSILHGSLEFFEFGEIIKIWTKILYKDFTVKIQNNGQFSEKIKIKKGVHQGGCCSTVYFLVIAEILALCLRANEKIEGITIQDIKNLLNQFADDMDIFSDNKEESIKTILEELDRFKMQSGFTLSYEKTTLYRIGSLRFSNASMYNIDEVKWSKEDINVLGVTIAHDNLMEKNYTDIVDKVKKTLNAWNNRGLTLLGKVQVINTLVASLFVYKMMVLPTISKKIIKNVENQMRDFIWNGKKAKIALKTLQNSKREGGLGLVNLGNKDIALKAT